MGNLYLSVALVLFNLFKHTNTSDNLKFITEYLTFYFFTLSNSTLLIAEIASNRAVVLTVSVV
jgi:hypothetical protein